jgi:hypothetical protein
MCRIPIRLTTTTPDGTTITSANGRYRVQGNNTWNNFSIDLNDPKTENITSVGQYDLEVNVTNSDGATSGWATSTFTVSEDCGGDPICAQYRVQWLISGPGGGFSQEVEPDPGFGGGVDGGITPIDGDGGVNGGGVDGDGDNTRRFDFIDCNTRNPLGSVTFAYVGEEKIICAKLDLEQTEDNNPDLSFIELGPCPQ